MTPRERLAAMARGEAMDRVPFMPTLLEHAALLTGQVPSRCATDAGRLEEAHVAAYRTYRHDLVTVGIDIYDIEAEALGCGVRFQDDGSVPGIVHRPFQAMVPDDDPPLDADFSPDRGRIGLVLAAASGVLARIGREVPVSVPVCGPFSLAVELCGFDGMVDRCLEAPRRALDLLERLLSHQEAYVSAIRSRGLDVTVFESWAAPPLLSPDLYEAFAVPFETRLVRRIRSEGGTTAPLVIGGNTTAILDGILSTGTTLLVADGGADPGLFARKAAAAGCTLRGNLDPRLMETGPIPILLDRVDALLSQVGPIPRFVLGSGVVSFRTPGEHLLAVRQHLEIRGPRPVSPARRPDPPPGPGKPENPCRTP